LCHLGSAQRLSASLDVCSTPFGITEVGTALIPNTSSPCSYAPSFHGPSRCSDRGDCHKRNHIACSAQVRSRKSFPAPSSIYRDVKEQQPLWNTKVGAIRGAQRPN